MGMFSRLACSTKFERSARDAWHPGGQFAQRGNISLISQRIVRSGKVFPSLPFPGTLKRPAMIQPDLEIGVCSGCRYGLISPSNNCRFARSYWLGIVSALPRSSVTTAYARNTFKDNKVR